MNLGYHLLIGELLNCESSSSVVAPGGAFMSGWKLTYRGIIYPWHCDHMGHMNVMWYNGKFDEACWQLLALLGLGSSRFQQDGTGMAAVEQHTRYRRELHAGDAITIHSALLEVKDKSIHMLHKMVHEPTGEVAATTVVIGVHIDSTIRKAIPLPEDVRQTAMEITEQAMAAFKECVEDPGTSEPRTRKNSETTSVRRNLSRTLLEVHHETRSAKPC